MYTVMYDVVMYGHNRIQFPSCWFRVGQTIALSRDIPQKYTTTV